MGMTADELNGLLDPTQGSADAPYSPKTDEYRNMWDEAIYSGSAIPEEQRPTGPIKTAPALDDPYKARWEELMQQPYSGLLSSADMGLAGGAGGIPAGPTPSVWRGAQYSEALADEYENYRIKAFSDNLQNLGAGGAGLIGALSSGFAYGARRLSDLVEEGGIRGTVRGDIADGLDAISRALEGGARDWAKSVKFAEQEQSPEWRERATKSWLTANEDAAWKDPLSVWAQATNSLPSIAVSVLPLVSFARAGRAAQIAAATAGEVSLSTSYVADQIRADIDEMTDEQLQQQSAWYKVARSGGMPEDDAREKMKTMAQDLGVIVSGGITTIAGAPGAALMAKSIGMAGRTVPGVEKAVEKLGEGLSGRWYTRAGKGGIGEALSEAPQEGGEQLAGNIAAQETYEPTRETWKGVGEAAVAGGAIGALYGAPPAIANNERKKRAVPPEISAAAEADKIVFPPVGIPPLPGEGGPGAAAPGGGATEGGGLTSTIFPPGAQPIKPMTEWTGDIQFGQAPTAPLDLTQPGATQPEFIPQRQTGIPEWGPVAGMEPPGPPEGPGGGGGQQAPTQTERNEFIELIRGMDDAELRKEFPYYNVMRNGTNIPWFEGDKRGEWVRGLPEDEARRMLVYEFDAGNVGKLFSEAEGIEVFRRQYGIGKEDRFGEVSRGTAATTGSPQIGPQGVTGTTGQKYGDIARVGSREGPVGEEPAGERRQPTEKRPVAEPQTAQEQVAAWRDQLSTPLQRETVQPDLSTKYPYLEKLPKREAEQMALDDVARFENQIENLQRIGEEIEARLGESKKAIPTGKGPDFTALLQLTEGDVRKEIKHINDWYAGEYDAYIDWLQDDTQAAEAADRLFELGNNYRRDLDKALGKVASKREQLVAQQEFNLAAQQRGAEERMTSEGKVVSTAPKPVPPGEKQLPPTPEEQMPVNPSKDPRRALEDLGRIRERIDTTGTGTGTFKNEPLATIASDIMRQANVLGYDKIGAKAKKLQEELMMDAVTPKAAKPRLKALANELENAIRNPPREPQPGEQLELFGPRNQGRGSRKKKPEKYPGVRLVGEPVFETPAGPSKEFSASFYRRLGAAKKADSVAQLASDLGKQLAAVGIVRRRGLDNYVRKITSGQVNLDSAKKHIKKIYETWVGGLKPQLTGKRGPETPEMKQKLKAMLAQLPGLEVEAARQAGAEGRAVLRWLEAEQAGTIAPKTQAEREFQKRQSVLDLRGGKVGETKYVGGIPQWVISRWNVLENALRTPMVRESKTETKGERTTSTVWLETPTAPKQRPGPTPAQREKFSTMLRELNDLVRVIEEVYKNPKIDLSPEAKRGADVMGQQLAAMLDKFKRNMQLITVLQNRLKGKDTFILAGKVVTGSSMIPQNKSLAHQFATTVIDKLEELGPERVNELLKKGARGTELKEIAGFWETGNEVYRGDRLVKHLENIYDGLKRLDDAGSADAMQAHIDSLMEVNRNIVASYANIVFSKGASPQIRKSNKAVLDAIKYKDMTPEEYAKLKKQYDKMLREMGDGAITKTLSEEQGSPFVDVTVGRRDSQQEKLEILSGYNQSHTLGDYVNASLVADLKAIEQSIPAPETEAEPEVEAAPEPEVSEETSYAAEEGDAEARDAAGDRRFEGTDGRFAGVADEVSERGYATVAGPNERPSKGHVDATTFSDGAVDEAQINGINIMMDGLYVKGNSSFLLADGTGFGKTRQLLGVAEMTKRQNPDANILMVLPDRNVERQYKEEAKAMGVDIKQFKILTYHSDFQALIDMGVGYDLIIYDEAHRLKNFYSARTQTIPQLSGKKRIYVSATPADSTGSMGVIAMMHGNHTVPAMQAWTKKNLGISIPAINNGKTTFVPINGKRTTHQIAIERLAVITEKLASNFGLLRRTRPQHTKPQVVTVDEDNTLFAKHGVTAEEMDQMSDRYWQEQRNADPSRPTREYIKQSGQLAERAKLTAVKQMILDALNPDTGGGRSRPILVVGEHTPVIKIRTLNGIFEIGSLVPEIEKWAKGQGLNIAHFYGKQHGSSNESYKAFHSNNGQYDMLITTVQTGGTGIDLDGQQPGDRRTMIVTQMPYSPAEMEQLLGRVDRKSTVEPAQILLPMVNFTGDVRRFGILQAKTEFLQAARGGRGHPLEFEAPALHDPNAAYRLIPKGMDKTVVKIKAGRKHFSQLREILEDLGTEMDKTLGGAVLNNADVLRFRERARIVLTQGEPSTTHKLVESTEEEAQRKDENDNVIGRKLRQHLDPKATKVASLNDALDIIAQEADQPFYRMLAKLLRGLNLDVGVIAAAGPDPALQKLPGMLRLNGAQGMYTDRSFANNKHGTILLDFRKGLNAHVVLHEAMHAATVMGFKHGLKQKSPGAVQLNAVWKKLVAHHLQTQGDSKPYGLSSPSEMIAEGFSNPEFREYLRRIELKVDNRNQSLWSRFVDGIRKYLNALRGRDVEPVTVNALDQLDDLISGVIEVQRAGDYSAVAYEEAMPGQSTIDMKRRREINKFLKGESEAHKYFVRELGPEVGNGMRPLLEKITGSSQGFRSALEEAGYWKDKALKYPLMTLRQLEEVSKGTPIGNSLAAYGRGVREKDARAKDEILKADRIHRMWADLEVADQDQTNETSQLMIDTTMAGIWVTESFDSDRNKHLRPTEKDEYTDADEAVEQRNKAKYNELKARYDALDDNYKKLYTEVQNYYQNVWDTTVQMLKRNVFLQFGIEPDTLDENNALRKETKPDTIIEYIDLVTDEEFSLSQGQREDLLAAIKNIDRRAKVKGPYFPLRRFGDYAVDALTPEETMEYDSVEDAKAALRRMKADDPSLIVKRDGSTLHTRRRIFELAPTMEQARKRAAELEDEGFTDINANAKREHYNKNLPTGAVLEEVLNKAEDTRTRTAIRQAFLEMMPETSIRKSELRRKLIEGVKAEDMRRGFAAHSQSSAHYLAQLEFGRRIARAKVDMQTALKKLPGIGDPSHQLIVNEISKRDELDSMPHDPSRIVGAATDAGFMWYLASPSYWIVNATQPHMIATPWIAGRVYNGKRVGAGDATAAMNRAYRAIRPTVLKRMKKAGGGFGFLAGKRVDQALFEFFSTETGTIGQDLIDNIRKSDLKNKDEVIRMLNELGRTGIIDMTFAADLRAAARGRGDTKWDAAMEWARIMPHLTEVMNRTVTAIAAYEAARAAGLTEHQAMVEAEQAISRTQFDYSASNKPRYFSERNLKLARPIFMFMQHSQHMYFLMLRNFFQGSKPIMKALRGGELTEDEKAQVKESWSTLAGVTATHALTAGIVGATFEPIKIVIGMLGWMYGLMFPDEEPFDYEMAVRRFFHDSFKPLVGSDAAKWISLAAAKGPITAMGIDLTTRINLNNLMFFDKGDNLRGRDKVMSTAFELFGPIGSAFANVAEGFVKMEEGDYLRGLELMLPKGVRDIVRSGRLASEGMLDNTGNVIRDTDAFNPVELFMQAMGVSPTAYTEPYARIRAVKNAQSHFERRKNVLMERYYRAGPRGRSALWRGAFRDFNDAVPLRSMKLTRDYVDKSVKEKKRREARMAETGGVYTSKKLKKLAEYYGDFSMY